MNHKYKKPKSKRPRCLFKRCAGGAACSCGWISKSSKAKRIPYPFKDQYHVKNKWQRNPISLKFISMNLF